jgi:hypothetical protein
VSVSQDITVRVDDDPGTNAPKPPDHQGGFAAFPFLHRAESSRKYLDNTWGDSFYQFLDRTAELVQSVWRLIPWDRLRLQVLCKKTAQRQQAAHRQDFGTQLQLFVISPI